MTRKGQVRSWVAALIALTQTGWGQSASPWRAYKIADGLPEPACSSVTVSPQGTVLARHLNAPALSRLDGYAVTILPAPPALRGRCYESPAGQLWSAAPEGLYEFKEGAWIHHAVAEIAAETRISSSGSPYGVPLFVVRQGRVIFLLRDRLAALNAEDPERIHTEVLRLAGETRLGVLLGLTPARDGGLWLSGSRGLAKLPAPVRNLKTDTEWREFEVPDALAVRNLREPREDADGGVTAIGESTTGKDPVLVQFDGQHWTVMAAGSDRIQFAWHSFGTRLWAVTPTALLSRPDDLPELVPDDEISARRFFDMAMEPSGAFWLATSDGLFRYSPPLWQAPGGLQMLRGSVSAVAEDAEGRLWFVSGGELHSVREGAHQNHPLPDLARRWLPTTRALIPLANGALLFVTDDQLFRLDPTRSLFGSVSTGRGDDTLQYLGVLNDGIACSQRLGPNNTESEYRIETYDGSQFRAFPISPPVPALGPTLLALYQARNGDLWLSGEAGVARRRGNQWKVFLAASQTAPESALWFTGAADDRVWCATADRIWGFDGREWSMLRGGFDHINAVSRSRDGDLWVASNSGLHRLTAAGWVENGIEEGLPSIAIRGVCEDRRGRLWVGTSQGLSLHHPEADTDPPRTEILAPSERRILEGGSINLAFSAQDKWKFTPRRRLMYSHRLDEQDWTPFQEFTTATLVELPAGKHTLFVRAMDRNGNVETKPAQLAFTVALPWFKETRLVGIAVLGAAVALFFAALAFNRHLRLRRSYAEVERKIAERTRELEIASRELVHSQKMNALGTLAAGIAHDFNNILSIVKGSAQIIEENLENPSKIQTRLDRIKTVVEQGAGIVQAMLGFSRRSEGTPEPCDVNAVVDSTITLLGDRFLRDVEVHFERAPVLPPVPVAKDLVQQVLLNFIFNAAEAMSGPKRVVLRTTQLERLPESLFLKPAEAGAYVGVSVQDFGCGIPPENLERIFEPFFTTKALSSRRGTGLGLSMAYELAKHLNAGLNVESAVGRGSRFTLILPVPNVPAPAETKTPDFTPATP